MMLPEFYQIEGQLLDRRQRLQDTIAEISETKQFVNLLHEVDAALERIGNGTFGRCEVCREPIEQDRVQADPLVRFCLDHLDSTQKKALEQDLHLASRIQQAMLPQNDLVFNDWQIYYRYEPAGAVSGDYCDLVDMKNSKDMLFILGDVSGKGVAASMLMSHLHAIFHSLSTPASPIDGLVKRANRLLCESTLSTHYSTLVCGKLCQAGRVEICNAGHCPPVLIKAGKVVYLKTTGLPVGLICETQYSVHEIVMDHGDSLLLYTDGLSEAFRGEIQYSEERISLLASQLYRLSAREIVNGLQQDFSAFLSGNSLTDDLTIMVIKRD